MTKKDYILIADALRRSRPSKTEPVWCMGLRVHIGEEKQIGREIQHAMMCTNIMEALAAENPRFSEEKFIAYLNK